jgi:hypothetical protein
MKEKIRECRVSQKELVDLFPNKNLEIYIKKKLKDVGFNLFGEIFSNIDFKTLDRIYVQKYYIIPKKRKRIWR